VVHKILDEGNKQEIEKLSGIKDILEKVSNNATIKQKRLDKLVYVDENQDP